MYSHSHSAAAAPRSGQAAEVLRRGPGRGPSAPAPTSSPILILIRMPILVDVIVHPLRTQAPPLSSNLYMYVNVYSYLHLPFTCLKPHLHLHLKLCLHLHLRLEIVRALSARTCPACFYLYFCGCIFHVRSHTRDPTRDPTRDQTRAFPCTVALAPLT